MKKVILIALLCATPEVWAATYFSRASSAWATNSTWSTASCGGAAAAAFPVAGDTVTVCAGHTVTASADFAFGNGNATDLAIQAGATLIDDGRTMTQGGGITLIGTLTLNAGSTWSPSGAYATTYQGTTTPATLNLNGIAVSRVTLAGDATHYTWIVGSNASQVINFTCHDCDLWLGGGANNSMTLNGGGNAQAILFDHCLCKFQTRFNFGQSSYPSAASTFKFTDSDLRFAASTALVFGIGGAGAYNFNADTNGIWETTIAGLDSGNGSSIVIRHGATATSQFVISNVVTQDACLNPQAPVAVSHLGSYAHLAPTSQCGATSVYDQAQSGTSTYTSNVAWGDFTNAHFFSVAPVSAGAGHTAIFSSQYSEGADPSGLENHYLPDDLTGINGTVSISNSITRGGNAVISRRATSGSVTIDHLTHVANSNTDCDSLWIDESTTPTLTTAVLRNSLIASTCTNAGMKQLVNGALQGGFTLTYANYNGYYDVASASRYVSTTVTGHSLPDASFGDHDVAGDPLFVNGAASIATWDASLGGPGTVANAFANLMCMHGYARSGAACTPNATYSVTNLLAYITAAYAPRNPALRGAANDGGDIGAVPVLSARRRASVTWR